MESDTLLQLCNETPSIRKYILYRSHAYALHEAIVAGERAGG